jgi:hypothetical protein
MDWFETFRRSSPIVAHCILKNSQENILPNKYSTLMNIVNLSRVWNPYFSSKHAHLWNNERRWAGLQTDAKRSIIAGIWPIPRSFSQKIQVSTNWLKSISSCRAEKVASTVKISASNVILIRRYLVHKFSWKMIYFAKKTNNSKFSDLHLFTTIRTK